MKTKNKEIEKKVSTEAHTEQHLAELFNKCMQLMNANRRKQTQTGA